MIFEKPEERRSKTLWKVLPVAVILLGGAIALFAYFGTTQKVDDGPLTGILREGNPDYGWYRKYVFLEKDSVKIKMGQNFAGKRMVMFTGVINNEGEKPLDVVEVKLVFFNYDKPVWETERTPVRPGPYTPPIPPMTKRSFTLYLENVPEGWHASNAEMSISGFRFATHPVR